MDQAVSEPSTSAIPGSASRTIPITLTSTPARVPEVHIKEISEADEISEVSEASQSVCHVIKIRKLNRPSSMYNNPEAKKDIAGPSAGPIPEEELSKTPVPPSNEPPQEDVKQPEPLKAALSPMMVRKEEAKEAAAHVLPEVNLIAIKAVGIITECEGPDNDSSEEVSSKSPVPPVAKAEIVPPVANSPSESGPPKSWKNQKRESINSGSSQFDVSEIPLDLVDIKDPNSNTDAFIHEGDGKEETHYDDTSKPPKSPKVTIQVQPSTTTASETVALIHDKASDQPSPVVSLEAANAKESVVQSDEGITAPGDIIHVTKFEVAEAVAVKQEESPVISTEPEEAAASRASQEPTECINVTHFTVEDKPEITQEIGKSVAEPEVGQEDTKDPEPEMKPVDLEETDIPAPVTQPETQPEPQKDEEKPKSDEQSSEPPVEDHQQEPLPETSKPGHISDLIPHEEPEDKIHVPERPKSASALEHEHKQASSQVSPTPEVVVDTQAPDYNPLDDPNHPEYRPIIHQSSFEIPIIFEKKSTGDGPVRTAFALDEVHWDTDISERSAKSDKGAQDKGTAKKEEPEAKEIRSEKDVEESDRVIEAQKADIQEGQKQEANVEPWVALEDVKPGEEVVEHHILETVLEEPQKETPNEPAPSQEAENPKTHGSFEKSSPPPVTELHQPSDEVDIHFPLEKSLEKAPEKHQSPTTTTPTYDRVVDIPAADGSPDRDDSTYYSVATHNIATDSIEEQQIAKEAAEVQKETEKMISYDTDESMATSFYSAAEKLSEATDKETDREKTPEVTVGTPKASRKELPSDTLSQEKQVQGSQKDKPFHRRQIPVIIETKSELDTDDISITIEDLTEEEEKPQVTLRKDRQKQPSTEEHPKPTVAVAPTSRPSETEKVPSKDEKKDTTVVVTRPTSVIRTDENDDSEAPLMRGKRKELAELEDILGEEIKVGKKEHKFDEIIPEERTPRELERKPSTPFYDESTSEVPVKYRSREAKLIQRLSEQTTSEDRDKPGYNGASTYQQKQALNEPLSPRQNGQHLMDKSMTESIIRDLREVNHALTHSPKSPSPHRFEECYSPRTLSRFHNPNVVFKNNEGGEVIHHHPVFVKDTSKYWYKPTISREEAINMLRDKPPGTFVVRDSNSFQGAFGLALKVAKPPEGVPQGDGTELVRHFLIEPSSKGVKLKGCNNEPVFGTLAALVYQHSITPMALPCRLLLPEYDPASTPEHLNAAQALLEQGAACNVTYIYSFDTESLTGPEAVRRAVHEALEQYARGIVRAVNVHFKVSSQGITLTDNTRTLFFRRHYPTNSVIYAGIDPEDRKWDNNSVIQLPPTYVRQARVFGFVARKISTKADNACHVFAELDPEQPATAVVNFITKVMMGQQSQQRGRTLPTL